MLAPTLQTFAPIPSGLSWQSIAIDRSQAFAAAFNLATVSRGDGGGAVVAARWSAKVGAGVEATAMRDGTLCNSVGGVSARGLFYSLPLRSLEPNAGAVQYAADTVILDCLIDALGPNADTGVFLLQSDGTIAGTPLPSAGGSGLGFLPDGGGVGCWTSNLGAVGHSGPVPGGSLCRCTMTMRSARTGQAGTFQMAVNGVPVAGGSFSGAVGNGPNQGYAAGLSLYLPVVSCGAGILYVADLSVLCTQPGFI